MQKIKETLWADYDNVSKLINGCTNKDDGYKMLLEERDKIRNELIKFEQAKIDADLKKQQMVNEVKIKTAQIDSENKREKIRNQITIGTFTVTTCMSLYAIIRTFRFDQEATITSTLGRSILNGVVPKMFRR